MGTSAGMVEAIKVSSDGGRVPVANGDAASHAAEAGTVPAPLSLRRRLLNAQAEAAKLEKDVDVKQTTTKDGKQFGGYKGVSAAQVVAIANEIVVRNGILYIPKVDKSSVNINGNKTTFWVDGRFESIDDPSDFEVQGAWGSGTDNADQGFAKAYTNADKQILVKTLRLSTFEIKEDNEVPHEPDGTKAVLDKAKQDAAEDKNKTLKAWADNLAAALKNATTVKEINDLQRANSQQLMHEELPGKTKDYFIDLIERRKALLGGSDA